MIAKAQLKITTTEVQFGVRKCIKKAGSLCEHESSLFRLLWNVLFIYPIQNKYKNIAIQIISVICSSV